MLVAVADDIGLQGFLGVEAHSLGLIRRLQLSLVAFTVCTFEHPFCVCVRLYLPVAYIAREFGIGEHTFHVGDI